LTAWKNTISQYLEIEKELAEATQCHELIKAVYDSYRRELRRNQYGKYKNSHYLYNQHNHNYVKRRIRNIVRSSMKTRRVNKFLREIYEYKQYKNLNEERDKNENKIENRATGI